MNIRSRAALAALFVALAGPGAGASAAPVYTVGAPFESPLPPDITALDAGSFLVPVLVSDAVSLQHWQVDLRFDPTVVHVVASDPFSLLPGLYGARFDAADPASLSFLLGGFVFDDLGLVDDIAGSYPGLLDGITGSGTLAYVEFAFRAGHEGEDPGIHIDVPAALPEPATVLLAVAALSIAAAIGRHAPQEDPK
jgi:hypothetical protein